MLQKQGLYLYLATQGLRICQLLRVQHDPVITA